MWQEQKSSLVTIISSHSSTCSVIFKHTCFLSALLYAVLFGPTAESSSGPDSGSREEYCSQAGMLYRRLCRRVTCVIWFLIMYGGRSLFSITFSHCLCICSLFSSAHGALPPGTRLCSERIVKLYLSFINMIKLNTFRDMKDAVLLYRYSRLTWD